MGRQILLSAGIATGVTGLGWVLLTFNSHSNVHSSFLALFGVVLEIPGVFLTGFAAMIFLPDGVHGIGTLIWMIYPVSWISYLILFGWIIDRRNRKNRFSRN